MLSLACVLLIASSCTLSLVNKDPMTTPLNEWPMIMAHDAAVKQTLPRHHLHTLIQPFLLHGGPIWIRSKTSLVLSHVVRRRRTSREDCGIR